MLRMLNKLWWFAPVLLLVLYLPILKDAFQLWMTDEDCSYCVLIFPTTLFLLWLKREEIKTEKVAPTTWGMLPLILGLVLQCGAVLYALPYIGMWSIVPVLAGLILLFGGFGLWKVVQFPVCYLLLAGSIPTSTLAGINHWIQHASTIGAALLGQELGFILVREGNYIQVPGMSLEVMMACSGYKKLSTLISFALLYGYLFTPNIVKRVLLVVSAVPIAVAANALRITGLIAASSAGGMRGYSLFHSPTDLVAMLLAVASMVLFGKTIRCTSLRYSL